MKKYQIIVFCLGFFLFSCSEKNEDITPRLGYEFFPLEEGTYIIYKTDTIFHDHPVADIPGIHDTLSYFIKEVVGDEFIDAEGKNSKRIVRYKRNTEEDNWELKNIWYARISAASAQRVEENRRYVKLGFPISTQATWDANALNDQKEWKCKYDSIYSKKKINNIDFQQTVSVNQHKYLTEVNDEYGYEIYAKDVGLIFRHHKVLFTRPSYLNNRVAKNIISGYEYKWEIVEYGVE